MDKANQRKKQVQSECESRTIVDPGGWNNNNYVCVCVHVQVCCVNVRACFGASVCMQMWSPEVKVGCHSSGTMYLDFWDRAFFFLTWNSLSKQVGPRFLKIHCPTSPVLAPTLTSVCRCGEDSQTQVFMLSQHEALFWLSYELFSQDNQNSFWEWIAVFGTNILNINYYIRGTINICKVFHNLNCPEYGHFSKIHQRKMFLSEFSYFCSSLITVYKPIVYTV